jgi:Bacterial Ig domain/SprB repeat/Domain of unknown function DUF11
MNCKFYQRGENPFTRLLSTRHQKSTFLFLGLLLAFFSFHGKATAQMTESFPAGSFIVDMGILPQTINNGLRPYGMVFTLLQNGIPVVWSINPNKTKDGADFIYNGKQYKGGTFLISSKYASLAQPIINTWVTANPGLTVVTTTSVLKAPVFITLRPRVVLDAGKGAIAQSYLTASGISLGPISRPNYYFKNPQTLDCCDDVFAMPHADPTWATHSNLATWNNTCKGAIWAACHAVSALENSFNPANPTQQLNFLASTTGNATGAGPWAANNAGLGNTLMLWGKHSGATIPPPLEYDHAAEPPMQFMETIDAATFNGSEQIYITVNKNAAQWRPTTKIGAWDDSQADIPVGVDKAAVKVAFGPGMGDPARGKVMYEAGHSHAGTAPANIAAQRAFMNFIFWSSLDKAILVSATTVPTEIIGGTTTGSFGVTVSAAVPSAPYTYRWTSSCGGVFSNTSGTFNTLAGALAATSTTFTAPAAPTASFYCPISCKIIDACGREVYFSESPLIKSVPAPPVANLDEKSTLPETKVTVKILTNDTDPNLEVLTVTGLGLSGTLTRVTTANGEFVTGPNNTVLYKPNPLFLGVDSVIYRICDPTGLCDTAWIKITVGEAVGPCGVGKRQISLGQGTAVAYDNTAITGVGNPGYALGLSDANYAELDKIIGAFTIDLGKTFNVGDTIKLNLATRDLGTLANQYAIFKVEGSASLPATFSAAAVSIPTPSKIFKDYTYVVTAANTRYVRIQNTSAYSKGRVNALTYDIKVCVSSCSPTEKEIVRTKYGAAVSSFSGVSNPTNITGTPNLTYAEYDAAADVMVVDLGEIVPQNSAVALYMILSGSTTIISNINVSGSPTTSGFTSSTTFPVHADKAYAVYRYEVTQATGVRYLQINGWSGSKAIRMDAVKFPSLSCLNVLPLALPDTITVCEDNFFNFNPLNNDLDPQGKALTVSVQTNPKNGIATAKLDGTITYIPNADFFGMDSLVYKVCNTDKYCTTQTVRITVIDDGCTAGQSKLTQYITTSLTLDHTNSSIEDTYLDEGNPSKNFGITTSIFVDRESDQNMRTLIKFNTSAIPTNAIITSASLQLVQKNSKIDNIQVYRANNTWTEGTIDNNTGQPNWNVRTGTTAWNFGSGGDYDTTRVWATATTTSTSGTVVNWNVTNLLQAWNDGILNQGFLLRAANEAADASDNGVEFYSSENSTIASRPKLVITYKIPDCAVTVCAVTPNRPPLANPEKTCTDYNTPSSYNVAANDIDIEGTTAPNGLNINSVAVLSGYLGYPKYGSATASSGNITYTPTTGSVKVDTVYYTIADFAGEKDTAYVVFCILNIPIIATDDNNTTLSGTPVTTMVAPNDINPLGGIVEVMAQSDYPPSNGSIVIENGNIIYTPNAGFTGTDQFEYIICNNNFAPDCDTALVTITVQNQAPLPEPDIVSTSACTPLTISPLDNDRDPESNDLKIIAIGTPSPSGLGIFSLQGNNIVFSPNATFSGAATVTLSYTVEDNGTTPMTASSTVTVNVGAAIPNIAPIAERDTADTNMNTTLWMDVLTNDSDPNNDQLKLNAITTQPLHGTVTMLPNDLIEYTPTVGFVGLDSLRYQVCDLLPIAPACTRTPLCSTTWLVVDVLFVELPKIRVTKSASTPIYNPDGSFDMTYSVKVNNTGNIVLTDVQVFDTLTNTFLLPATFTLVAPPLSTLAVNSGFTGTASNTTLLATDQTLAAGDSATISFTVRVVRADYTTKVFNNLSYASGVSPLGIKVKSVTSSKTYIGCQGDGYSVTVNGTVYNEAKPTGREILVAANGSDSVVMINLVFNALPTTTLTATESSCTPNDNKIISAATVTLNATGVGTITWNNGLSAGSSHTINPTVTTTYTVTLTDVNGCIATASKNITAVIPPDVSILNVAVGCAGATTSATIQTSLTGGVAPITFEWTLDPSTTVISTVSNPSFATNGVYNAKVTDQSGCVDIASVTISVPNPLSISHIGTPPNCNGGNGTIEVNISGGSAPFTITYSKGGSVVATHTSSTSPVQDFLNTATVGVYNVDITDANGCMVSFSETITEPTLIAISNAAPIDPKCFGSSDGSIDASISGGTPSYTYNWKKDGVSYRTTEDLTNALAGSYVLQVTDLKGCVVSSSAIILTQPSSLPSVTIASTETSGTSNDDKVLSGSIVNLTASGSGGTSAYTYAWDKGLGSGITQTPSVLATTTYTVTVTDANNCTASATKTITVVSPPEISVAATETSCTVNNDNVLAGAIANLTATGLGGTSPYTYSWDNGLGSGDSKTPTVSATTTYTVTVTDANGMTATATKTISIVSLPDFTLAQATICPGEMDYVIISNLTNVIPATAQVKANSGAYKPYPTPAYITTVQGIIAGNNTITVINTEGCETSKMINVTLTPAASCVPLAIEKMNSN